MSFTGEVIVQYWSIASDAEIKQAIGLGEEPAAKLGKHNIGDGFNLFGCDDTAYSSYSLKVARDLVRPDLEYGVVKEIIDKDFEPVF